MSWKPDQLTHCFRDGISHGRRVSSPKTGKEATTDSGGGMQYSGGGISEAKSGGEATSDVKHVDAASSPASVPAKVATTTTTRSTAPTDPFEFDDNDQPPVDKGGGSKQKTYKGKKLCSR